MRKAGAAGKVRPAPAAVLIAWTLTWVLSGCGPAPATAPVPTAAASGTATDTAPVPTAGTAPGGIPGGLWAPVPGESWQWQLSGAVDPAVEAQTFDVDYETTSREEVAALKAQGRGMICYLSAGSWEDFRGDAGGFPEAVRGRELSGWPGERWLDIRRMDVLLPLMAARMDICAAKGFDGVEPDNVDGYLNDTGFPLTAQDQLDYNRALAELAHARGLSVGLKNDIDQIPALVADFDFAVNEECFRYAECDSYAPFAAAGKAVLHVEYEGPLAFCAESERLGFSSMLKPLHLGPDRQPC